MVISNSFITNKFITIFVIIPVVMTNPFIYGQIVTGDSFTNRKKEKAQLASNLANGIHTTIISPRRWGKSSLVEEVVSGLLKDNNNIKYVKLDLTAVLDEKDFFNKYVKEVIKATNSKAADVMESIKNAFKVIKPQITIDNIDNSFSIGISLTMEEIEKGFKDILDLPETLAKKKKIRLIIALDEFQNIASFQKPAVFQGQLRSTLQYHKNVSYCFYGSKKHMMEEIFQDKSAPFYQFGDIINFKKISAEDFQPFLQKKFKATGKIISNEQLNQILSIMDYHPHFVQFLAYKVWETSDKRITDADIQIGVRMVVEQFNDFFQDIFEDLTKHQKSFLVGLIKSKESVFSQSFIKAYGLGSSANVSIVRNALSKKDIIDFRGDKPEFIDPTFRIWLESRL